MHGESQFGECKVACYCCRLQAPDNGGVWCLCEVLDAVIFIITLLSCGGMVLYSTFCGNVSAPPSSASLANAGDTSVSSFPNPVTEDSEANNEENNTRLRESAVPTLSGEIQPEHPARTQVRPIMTNVMAQIAHYTQGL